VTDAPSRQDTPENEDGNPSDEKPRGTQTQGTQTQDAPQWSAQQPEPAPWFLGRPGAVPPPPPPPPPGWPQAPLPPAPPLPPPTADQANWPDHAPGTRPEQQSGQEPQDQVPGQQGQGQNQDGQDGLPPVQDRVPVPPWTGQAPPNPERPTAGSGPAAGPQPQQPAPWHDPNRYGQPGPQQQKPRPPYGPPQPKREEPGERPPLSLRTRWARGLAIGGALCTLITLRYGYQDFPAWLIGAAVALVMSMGGLWCGVFAQRDAARRSQRAPEAVAAVVWSGISTLIAVGVVAISLAFFPQLRAYSDCMHSANTIAGQNACTQQLDHSMTLTP